MVWQMKQWRINKNSLYIIVNNDKEMQGLHYLFVCLSFT